MSVCLFVSNKRQNAWTDRAQIFCGASRDFREGLWIIKISNICLHQNSIVIKFFQILKISEIFCENPRIIFVLFYDVHKENMFTINLGDGREASSKARKKGAKRLEFLVYLYFNIFIFFIYWISNIFKINSDNLIKIRKKKIDICSLYSVQLLMPWAQVLTRFSFFRFFRHQDYLLKIFKIIYLKYSRLST